MFLELLGLFAQGQRFGRGQAFIIMKVALVPEEDREYATVRGHRSLLGELFGFAAHRLAVLLILIVIAIFARDFSIDFHTVLRESRSPRESR